MKFVLIWLLPVCLLLFCGLPYCLLAWACRVADEKEDLAGAALVQELRRQGARGMQPLTLRARSVGGRGQAVVVPWEKGGGGSIRCLTLRPFQSIPLSRFHVDNASLFLSKLFWGTVSKKTICVDLLLFHLCNQFSFFLGFPFFVLGPWALKVLWRHVHYSSYSLEITLQYIKVLVLLTDCFSPCQLNQTFNAPSRHHKWSVQSRAQSNGVEC